MIQYPHYLYRIVAGNHVQGADGEWISRPEGGDTVGVGMAFDGESGLEYDANGAILENTRRFVCMCRAELGGRANKLNVGDGKFVEYSAVVYMPKSGVSFKAGESVIVAADGAMNGIRIKGECVGFVADQLNMKLYIG